MDLSSIRAILFDVDGTLYHQLPLRILMCLELSVLPVHLGSVKKVRSVLRTLREFRKIREDLRYLKKTSDCLYELQYRLTAISVGIEEIEVERIVGEWIHERPLKYLKWCRRKGALSFFAQAHHRGMKLGVFSDYPAREKLKALELEPYIPLILCSTDREINALKPYPRGYLYACEIWGLQPHEVLYIGDRPEIDGKGADKAGMPSLMVGGTFYQKVHEGRSFRKKTSFRRLQQLFSI